MEADRVCGVHCEGRQVAKAVLNRPRLASLINDTAGRNNTSGLTVEARLLLNDFKQQVSSAA
jgi:hypothetical protein